MEHGGRKTAKREPVVLDLRGLRCPLPALRTDRALRRMRAGETLVVLADDPLARLDIAHLCATNGHALAETMAVETWTRFLIRCGKRPALSES